MAIMDKLNKTFSSGQKLMASEMNAISSKIDEIVEKKYERDLGGIPKSDLAAGVQSSLGKADTALQSDAISDMETRTHASQTYQPKGEYLTQHQDISGKVDKVEGKGLSTEDFTTELKTKLTGLSNYDDTAVRSLITSLQNSLDALTGTEDTTDVIDTMNEIVNFLNSFKNTDNLASVLQTLQTSIEQWVENKKYLTEHQSLAAYLTSAVAAQTYQPKGNYLTEHQSLAGLQPTITDLATIRDGASKGATAYQKPSGNIPKTDLATAVQNALLPSYSTGNNNQVLTIINGTPAWVSVASVYSGTSAPSNSLGTDGDIYIQTS